MHVLVNNGD